MKSRHASWTLLVTGLATWLLVGSVTMAQRRPQPAPTAPSESTPTATTPSTRTPTASSSSSESSRSTSTPSGRVAYTAPTAIGYVVKYEPDKLLTIEVKVNRAAGEQVAYTLVAGQTTVVPPKGAKTLPAGTLVSVWTDKNESKTATRVVATTPGSGARRGAAPATPTTRPSARGTPAATDTPTTTPTPPTTPGRRSAN